MSLSGAFYGLLAIGFTRRQALALATAGYGVVGYQRVRFVESWPVAA